MTTVMGDGEEFWSWAVTISASGQIREHHVTLRQGDLLLRPMTEGDWETLMEWDNDPEVLFYSEGGDVTGYTMEALQAQMRQISTSAFMFLIEHEGRPAGECWLQRMNLERLVSAHPGRDVRRIDLALARRCWGKRIGTRVIELLVDFAFRAEGVDLVYACDVADYNLRSLRAFNSAGFVVEAAHPQSVGKARATYDLVLDRRAWRGGLQGLPSRIPEGRT